MPDSGSVIGCSRLKLVRNRKSCGNNHCFALLIIEGVSHFT
jgi:hypothetical protein